MTRQQKSAQRRPGPLATAISLSRWLNISKMYVAPLSWTDMNTYIVQDDEGDDFDD